MSGRSEGDAVAGERIDIETGITTVAPRAGTGLLRQFIGFLVGSCLGLTIDLVIFALLEVSTNLPAGVINTVSSAAAVTAVYLVTTRYAFRKRGGVHSYLLFFGWYAFSIAVFSGVIAGLDAALPVGGFVAKLISVPFSFGANFLFSRLLFRSRFGGRGRGAA